MILSVPLNRPPIYSRTDAGSSRMGFGPFALSREASPLPLVTKIFWSPSAKRTLVGYQPTGIKPSDFDLPRSRMSKTAMLLLSALATINTFSSGETAKLFGVLPFFFVAYSEVFMTSLDAPFSVSSKTTELSSAHPTSKCFPSSIKTISVGWLLTGHSPATVMDSRLITATEDLPQRLTMARFLSGAITTSNGKLPAGNSSFEIVLDDSVSTMTNWLAIIPQTKSFLLSSRLAKAETTNFSLGSTTWILRSNVRYPAR